MMTKANPGLEGVVAAATTLSSVDGERGELLIGGYPVEYLARTATYEAVIHLLWEGRLPGPTEESALRAELGRHRALAPAVLELVRATARAGMAPMDALRTAISALPLGGATVEPLAIAGATASIVAAYARFSRGQEAIAADPALSHAADFLRMLAGVAPTASRARALDQYLIATVDHGLNASTFAARVIISTQSSFVAAITGAIGALAGPLHGGAPGPVLEMLFEAERATDRAAYLRAKLERGERLMGFGHRIYRVRDPRADVLARVCSELSERGEGAPIFEVARDVERIALRVLREHKPDRALDTNVELYTALVLHALGVPKELFTCVFAISRVPGWLAHAREQLATRKLIRPQSEYIGPRHTPPV